MHDLLSVPYETAMKSPALPGAVLFLSSCAAVRKVDTGKSMEIHGPGVIQNPVIADLDVQEQKVRGTATGRWSAATSVKQMARVNAFNTANADVLIAPVHEIGTKGNKTTVTVTGFAATYKNFRNATVGDSTLVEAAYMLQPNTVVVDDPPTRKASSGWIAGIAGLVVAGVLFVLLVLQRSSTAGR